MASQTNSWRNNPSSFRRGMCSYRQIARNRHENLSVVAHAKGHTPPKIIGVFLFLTALNAVGVRKMLDGLEATNR